MIEKSLFRKNYLIFASIVICFLILSLLSTWLLTAFERRAMERAMERGPSRGFTNLIRILDKDPIKSLEKLNELADLEGREKHDLVDAAGISLTTRQQVLKTALHPTAVDDLSKNFNFPSEDIQGKAVRVSSTQNPGVYLLSPAGPPGPGRPPGGGPPLWGPFILVGAIILFILLAIGVALRFQLHRYNIRAQNAFDVIGQMREGKLSARLPTNESDELAPLITAFNSMANDVQNIVSQLQKSDQARRQLLQDLAHDLRTPLTSLKTFIDTLIRNEVPRPLQVETLQLCSSEVEYFGKLVEDLLTLAQITEPKYSHQSEKIDVPERIALQLEVFRQRNPQIDYRMQVTDHHSFLTGNPALFDRLLRNGLENASRFAKKSISIEVQNNANSLEIDIIDDGPGFSHDSLESFGHKKASRSLNLESHENKISIGIGSVIMKEILQVHGGELLAANKVLRGEVLGAIVSFRFILK